MTAPPHDDAFRRLGVQSPHGRPSRTKRSRTSRALTVTEVYALLEPSRTQTPPPTSPAIMQGMDRLRRASDTLPLKPLSTLIVGQRPQRLHRRTEFVLGLDQPAPEARVFVAVARAYERASLFAHLLNQRIGDIRLIARLKADLPLSIEAVDRQAQDAVQTMGRMLFYHPEDTARWQAQIDEAVERLHHALGALYSAPAPAVLKGGTKLPTIFFAYRLTEIFTAWTGTVPVLDARSRVDMDTPFLLLIRGALGLVSGTVAGSPDHILRAVRHPPVSEIIYLPGLIGFEDDDTADARAKKRKALATNFSTKVTRSLHHAAQMHTWPSLPAEIQFQSEGWINDFPDASSIDP